MLLMARKGLANTSTNKTRPGLVRNAFDKVATIPAYRSLAERWKRR